MQFPKAGAALLQALENTSGLVRIGFFFSSRRRHTRLQGDWSSDVCSSDLLEMPAGIITVRAAGDRWTLQAKAPSWREVQEPRLTLAAILGLDERDIGERPLWVNAGTEQLVVPLKSEAAVRRVRVRADLLAQLASADGHSMAFVFAPSGAGLLARFFFPHGGSALEDPATGSATANLGGWCLAMGRTLPCEFEISQGEYTGRPSALRLRVDAERQIFVSGDIIELGRGTINL